MTVTIPVESRNKTFIYAGLVLLGTIAFSALFAWVNTLNYNWLSPQFEQNATATSWGIIQRLYLIIPGALIVLWKPKQLGFRVGKSYQYWKMLLVMMALNVGVIGIYLRISGATPYSGIGMVINEVVTVPLVEEVVWRGIVFSVILALLSKVLPEGKSSILAAIFSGICFGLLHASNALFGYSLGFVALQTVNATVWGLVYGIARAKTGSIYPPILLHAAMNLVVALG